MKPRASVLLLAPVAVFACGKVRVESVEAFGIADEETRVREAAAPCYMVEHPRGRLLWDGGVASFFA